MQQVDNEFIWNKYIIITKNPIYAEVLLYIFLVSLMIKKIIIINGLGIYSLYLKFKIAITKK